MEESESLHDPGLFLVAGPLWFIGPNHGPSEMARIVRMMPTIIIETGDGGTKIGAPVFTDSDNAHRWLAFQKADSFAPFRCKPLSTQIALLEALRDRPVELLVYDLGESHETGRSVQQPIADAIATLRGGAG